MDSESSQDALFCFKEDEKDLMAYEEEEMLAFEEMETSTMDNIKSESNAATTKENNFSVLMSAIDSFSLSGHSLSGDEPKVKVMHPVCASTPQHEFDFENGSALSLSSIFMPSPEVILSEGCDFVCDFEEGTVMIPNVEMVSRKVQDGDVESGHNTNAFPQVYEPPQPTKGLRSEVGHQLRLFHNERIVLQGISIWGINDTSEQTYQQDFTFNGIDIAGQLLEAAAAQMEPNVIVSESTLKAIANGLQLSIECEVGANPKIEQRGIGRMVADILLDTQTGIVMGFAVARLVPHPIINRSGGEQGSVLHQVIRGFAIDDNARRIITEGVGTAIWVVNQPSPSVE